MNFSITPIFQHINRTRRKLIGFELSHGGEVIGVFPSRSAAEAQIERITFELGRVLHGRNQHTIDTASKPYIDIPAEREVAG
jgi:hypothetical protein